MRQHDVEEPHVLGWICPVKHQAQRARRVSLIGNVRVYSALQNIVISDMTALADSEQPLQTVLLAGLPRT